MAWLIAFLCLCAAYYLLHKWVFKPGGGTERDIQVPGGGRRSRPGPLEKLEPGGIRYAVYRSLLEGNTVDQILQDPRFKDFPEDMGEFASRVRKRMDGETG